MITITQSIISSDITMKNCKLCLASFVKDISKIKHNTFRKDFQEESVRIKI